MTSLITQIVHTWSSFDYGYEGTYGIHSPRREAALQWYKNYLPHYPLLAGDNIGQVKNEVHFFVKPFRHLQLVE